MHRRGPLSPRAQSTGRPADPTGPSPPMAAWAGPTWPRGAHSRDPAGQLLPQVSGRGREWALGESVLQGSPSPCPGTPRPCSRDSASLLFPQVSAARRGCGGGRAHFLSARFLLPAGLWLYLAGSSLPCLTLIGSPNFGYRSVHRDLEAQIAIVTESRALQQQLHQVGWGCGAVGAQSGAWGLPPAGARGWERTGVL